MSDNKWKIYKEYNSYRGKINDNPNNKLIKEDNLPPGIYESDFQLLLYSCPDTKVLTNEVIKDIYFELKNTPIKDKLNNIIPNIWGYRKSICVLLAAVLLLFFTAKRRIEKTILLSSFLIFIFLLLYVSLDATLKGRVFMTSIFPLWWILFLTEANREYSTKYQRILYILLAGGLLFFFARLDVRSRKDSIYYRNIFLPEQEIIFSHLQSTDKYIIPFEDALQFRSISPFKISDAYAKNNVLALAWLSKIPFNKGKLESHLDLLGKKMFAYRFHMDDAVKYLSESIELHYNIKIKFEILAETENFILFKIIDSAQEHKQ